MHNKVIIWGADDFNTLGLFRELGESVPDMLFLIKGKKGMTARSRYCTQCVETVSVEDGFRYLMSMETDPSAKPIIITSGDGISVLIDQHKTELEQKYIIPGTRQQGFLEKYTDKYTMTSLAAELGIPTPCSKFVKWDSNIDDVSYPCIIKPSHQTPGHYNEFKFKICKNETALRKTLKYVRKESVFIVQQYIPKERDLLVYGARMQDGETVLAGCMIRDRMADSGSSSHGLMTNNLPETVKREQIAAFLDRIDYVGLFSFEYGLTADNAYFFEVNLRNDGCSHYFYQTGANIPLAWVKSCVGEDYSEVPTKVIGERWFIDEVFDIENVFHRRISFRQQKRDKKEATVFKYYDKNDLEPYRYVRKGRYKQLLQDLVLSRFRLYVVYILDKMGLRK